MNTGTRSEYYLLFAISFIAAIWFFVGYPSQDPRSAVDISFDEEEIKLKASEKFSELGFSISNYSIAEVSFIGNEQLLDSLQHKYGRGQAIELLEWTDQPNLKAFFWEVVFSIKRNSFDERQSSPPFRPNDDELRLYLDEGGIFAGLKNPSEYLPQKKVHRTTLGSVFYSSVDSLQKSVLTAVSDSLLSRMLYFDLQKTHGRYSDYHKKAEQKIRDNFSRGIPYRHSPNDARALADFYMSKTAWDTSGFDVDTTFIKRINTINAVNVGYVAKDTSVAPSLEINVVVAPTGALLQMNSNYVRRSNSAPTPKMGDIVHTIIILGLALAGLIIFFFRMRARTIDTQSALLVAVLMGVVSSAYIFLTEVAGGLTFSEGITVNESVFLFLQMGISGAFTAVGFFVLFAISDSLTRQHCPQKLYSYDYLRQGMILNKPIGVVIFRSIGLAFVLTGLSTLILAIFPQVYFSFRHIFISEQALWSPLFLLLSNTWRTLLVILAIFLVIGSLAYARSANRWIPGFFILLACGVLKPLFNSYGPPLYEFLFGTMLGVGLLFIYLRWDFLTVVLAHFLFVNLMGSVAGWIIPHSPDLFTFIAVVVLIIVMTVIGGLAIYMGKEQRSLPYYVPRYVEELAQEERIKQELQIAREVQQSFLPAKIPALPGLDIAAICQPAYETGGDYYDFILLDDHRVAVAIGDVSGKGIQAAFYMTLVKGMLHSLCGETDSPAKVLSRTNRLFYENATKGTFISLIYGIIDVQKRTFTFARAGHNPILHARISSGKIDKLQPRGLGIGLTKDKIFDNKIREIKLSISEDDLLLLYTDGITEALNESHQFFGTDRLIKLIKKTKHKPASEMIAAISKGVTQFIGNAKKHDDMTLMAIRFGSKES